MKKILVCMTALSALSVAGLATAGDAAAGKAKSGVCGACHGTVGMAPAHFSAYPNLAGQQEKYLVKQLADFKAGTRKDPIMGMQAAGLSDADIANLAAYYSAL